MKTPSPADLLSFLSLLEDLDQPPVVELLYNEKAPVIFDDDHATIGAKNKVLLYLETKS